MFRRESQRQNVEEDRRGYGGGSRSPTVEVKHPPVILPHPQIVPFEESDCGGEAWEELESEKATERQGERIESKEHSGNSTGKSDNGETREKVGEKIVGRDRLGGERACGGAGQNAPIKKCIRRGASVIVFICEVVYRCAKSKRWRFAHRHRLREERACGKLSKPTKLSTEERGCGPRRLPHVSRRGGEHSHG